MNIDYTNLTYGEQQLIDWQYHRLGGFDSALWSLITRADSTNLARLHRAYPHHVDAYEAYISKPGYWADVKRRAGIQEAA